VFVCLFFKIVFIFLYNFLFYFIMGIFVIVGY
jgi:hypothetical protein